MTKVFYFLFPLCVSATLLAEEAAPANRQQSMWQTLIMIGIALLFFYMILWRPEQKRRKKMQQQRRSMQKGDRIVAMGIIGTLVRIEKDTVILKMVDGATIEVLTTSISDVKPGSDQSAKSSEPQTNGA